MIQEFRSSSTIAVSLATQGKQSFRRNTSAWACTLGGSERNGNEDGVTTLWHGSQRGKMWLMQPSAARSIQSIDVFRCCTINKKSINLFHAGAHVHCWPRPPGSSAQRTRHFQMARQLEHQSQSSSASSMSTSSKGCSWAWAQFQYLTITSSDDTKHGLRAHPFKDLDYPSAST